MNEKPDPGELFLLLVYLAPPVCAAILAARIIRWAWN
jgi:hypothetical protein